MWKNIARVLGAVICVYGTVRVTEISVQRKADLGEQYAQWERENKNV